MSAISIIIPSLSCSFTIVLHSAWGPGCSGRILGAQVPNRRAMLVILYSAAGLSNGVFLLEDSTFLDLFVLQLI